MPKVVGKWRWKAEKPDEDNLVIYNYGDDPEDEMTEMSYRQGCYSPPFEELPWTTWRPKKP